MKTNIILTNLTAIALLSASAASLAESQGKQDVATEQKTSFPADDNQPVVSVLKREKIKERLQDACWEAYVACTALCELDLEIGTSDADEHNACMSSCRDKWNDCLDY